jgi:outer membrane receptor protein involved in Fe transport
MTVSGIAGFSMGGANTCNCPLHETMDYYQGVANLTWIRGKHTFKFGVDERRYTNFRLTTNNIRGSFTFSQGDTGSPAISNSGAGTASMLLGLVGSYSREFLNSQVGTEQEWHLFEYAQDTWRVTKRFTINYGLRYELYTPPATPVGAGANLDINTGNVMVAGIGGISRSVNVKTALHDFGLRLGLAYSLSDKTVIRAGAARSFFPNVYNVLISGNWPVIGTQAVSPTYTDVAVFNIANVYPAPTPPVVPSTGQLPLPNGISYTWNPLNRLNGMTDKLHGPTFAAVGY